MTQNQNKRYRRKILLVRIVALFFALLMLVFVLVALLPSCAPPVASEPTPVPTVEPTATPMPTLTPLTTASPSDLAAEAIPAAAEPEYVQPVQGGLIPLPLPDEARIKALIDALSIPRPMSSPEEAATCEFIKAQLSLLGFDVKTQELNESNTNFTRAALTFAVSVGDIPVTDVESVSGGSNGTGSSLLFNLDENTPLTANYDGKVVLMPNDNDFYSFMKMMHAGQTPAAFLLYPVETPGSDPTPVSVDSSVPVFSITAKFAKELKKKLSEGDLDATYSAAFALPTFRAYNVEASLLPASGKSDAPLYILCAHYDGEYCTPGANDNASGVAALLETARLMKDVRPDAEMRFVFFTGEEDGAIGSSYYVKNLSDADKVRIAGVVNLDMIASVNGGPILLYTLDGKSNPVVERFNRALTKYFPDLAQPKLNAEGRSDHVPFQKADIPAIMLSQIEVKGEYRTEKDNPSIISMDRVKEAVSWVMAFIACDTAAGG